MNRKVQGEFLRSVIDSISHPIYVIDVNDYSVILANKAGSTRSITSETTCFNISNELNEPCHGKNCVCPIEEIKCTRKPVTVEHVYHDSSGNPRYVEIHVHPIFDDKGDIAQIVEHHIDISERKSAERRAARRTKLLEAINKIFHDTLTAETLEDVASTCMDEAVHLTDSEFGILYELNDEQNIDAVGLTDASWLACKIDPVEAKMMLRRQVTRGILAPLITQKQIVISNDVASEPDLMELHEGHVPLKRFLGVPLIHGDKFVGIIGLANKESEYQQEDVEDIESLSVATVEALYRFRVGEDLENSRDLAEFFVDLMGHDLSNINQAIMGYLDIILYDETIPDQTLDIVRETITHLQRSKRLITNVRKFRSIGTSSPKLILCDPYQALSEAVNSVKSKFPDKQLELENEIVPGQYQVWAYDLLEDVFYNLLHNSMKSDPKESVKIEVKAIESDQFLRIELMDHGRGIPDTSKKWLFERISSKKEGLWLTGMGLTLVKHIIDHYGGQISINDRVEGDHTQGAKFVIQLRSSSLLT